MQSLFKGSLFQRLYRRPLPLLITYFRLAITRSRRFRADPKSIAISPECRLQGDDLHPAGARHELGRFSPAPRL